MKTKNAYTLTELIFVIVIVSILMSILLTGIRRTSDRVKKKQDTAKQLGKRGFPAEGVRIGDAVYIDGLDVTGRVNRIWNQSIGIIETVDILVKGSNGVPYTLEKVNAFLLKKVDDSSEWRIQQ